MYTHVDNEECQVGYSKPHVACGHTLSAVRLLETNLGAFNHPTYVVISGYGYGHRAAIPSKVALLGARSSSLMFTLASKSGRINGLHDWQSQQSAVQTPPSLPRRRQDNTSSNFQESPKRGCICAKHRGTVGYFGMSQTGLRDIPGKHASRRKGLTRDHFLPSWHAAHYLNYCLRFGIFTVGCDS